jgi:hypothetical protein
LEGKGWVETIDLRPEDRIDTASGADMVLLSLEQTERVEQTYNLTVADWHTFLVGEDQAVVHNASLCDRAAKLAGKLGRNRVFIRGAEGKVYAYDLAGKAHFDKSTRTWINTPHVKVGQTHVGPDGKSSTTWGRTRSMTEADFRTVNNYFGR